MNRLQKISIMTTGVLILMGTRLSWWLEPGWHHDPAGILATLAAVAVGAVTIPRGIYMLINKDEPTGTL